MVIPLSDCKLMPLELYPRVSTVRISAVQEADGNLKKVVRVPGKDLEFPFA
jgi:hypothetical protein